MSRNDNDEEENNGEYGFIANNNHNDGRHINRSSTVNILSFCLRAFHIFPLLIFSEMLGRLVSKFKRQTLQDGNGGGAISPPGQMSPPPTGREIGASGTRRSARLNEKAEKEKGGNIGGGGGIGGGTMPLGTSPSSPSPPNTVCGRALLFFVRRVEQCPIKTPKLMRM